MPTSLYVMTPGDLIYVKPDNSNSVRTYQVNVSGGLTEITMSATPSPGVTAHVAGAAKTEPFKIDNDTPLLPTDMLPTAPERRPWNEPPTRPETLPEASTKTLPDINRRR